MDELPTGGSVTVRIPMMGPALCAGFPSPADDFHEDAIELPRWLVPNPPATFLWRISGDSMRDAGIFDGDLACVDRSLKPSHGSVGCRCREWRSVDQGDGSRGQPDAQPCFIEKKPTAA